MKKFLVLALIAVALLSFAAPARAYVESVNVVNNSTSCAWVTVYRADEMSTWSTLSSANNRPRYVKPGEHYAFVVMDGTEYSQVKVVLQIDKNGSCTGGTVANMERDKEGDDSKVGSYYEVVLGGTNDHFTLVGNI